MAKFPKLDDSFPRIAPAFKQLVKIISECIDGGVSLNCTAFEFRQCDLALGTMLANFMEVVRLKEIPREQNAAVDEIVLLFCKMSSEMSKLETALGMDASAAAVSCINKIYDSLKDLEELNMDLKAAIADSHFYSEVPVVDSLLRAGNFVIETEGAEWDALASRLESLIPQWNEIVTGEGLPEEFTMHDQALEHLINVMNDRDFESLPAVLEEVKNSGEALVNFDDSQLEEETPSVTLCPYCGKNMAKGSSKCFACGARMPEAFERADGSSKKSEGTSTENMPDYIQRIFSVSENLAEDPKMFRPFKRAVGELRRRVADSISKVNKISSTKIKMTSEQRENVDGVVDLAHSSIGKFAKAVELLDGFELPIDKFHLQCALEVLADAVEEMRSVGGLAQKYRGKK